MSRCSRRLSVLFAGLTCLIITTGAQAEPKQIESAQMGVVATLPDGWKVTESKEAPPTATSEDGSVKLVMLYFEKLYLYQVVNSEKVAGNFAPALKDAKITAGEKAVINGLVGEKVNGTGTLAGKPVQFNCVLIGDKDNKGNTLAFIVVASEEAMKQHAKEISATLEGIRAKEAKEK